MKFVYICVFLLITVPSSAAPELEDILSWPRMDLMKFGCMLEKRFNYKDPKFNCSLKSYENTGDPCHNTAAYYQGIKFPERLVTKIHPKLLSLDLEWEHGDLRSVNISFKKKENPSEIKSMFGLPNNNSSLDSKPNIMSYSIQNCHKDYNCLILEGFDHVGAGDVDCTEITAQPSKYRQECALTSKTFKNNLPNESVDVWCADDRRKDFGEMGPDVVHAMVVALFYERRLDRRLSAMNMLEKYDCSTREDCIELNRLLDWGRKSSHIEKLNQDLSFRVKKLQDNVETSLKNYE